MAVLRFGKKTIFSSNNHSRKRKNKVKSLRIVIKKLTSDEIKTLCNLTQAPSSRYNLRATKNVVSVASVAIRKKSENDKPMQLAVKNSMWDDLCLKVKGDNLQSGFTILAKMRSYRPWPARINSMYTVNGELKCFVLFYGTHQIGSVSIADCVQFSHCGEYLFQELENIKAKYKWKKNYDALAQTVDLERTKVIAGLTLIQQFLLGIRDVEKGMKLPYVNSLVYN